MLNFVKLEGIGNDFILLDGIKQDLSNYNFAELAPRLCNRHFGIGADGLLLAFKSEKASYQMRIINSDGSEAEMCGNGIRCFARYIYEEYEHAMVLSIETLAGIMLPVLDPQNNLIEVDMGEPVLDAQKIPVALSGEKLIAQDIEVAGENFKFTPVSMGNPHAVIFVDDTKKIDVAKFGPLIEKHPLFPRKTNVEFVDILSRQEINFRVWERGAAETLACGTGACAAVVAGVLNDKTDRTVLVHLPGGDLLIEWQIEDNHVSMSGPAFETFRGNIKV